MKKTIKVLLDTNVFPAQDFPKEIRGQKIEYVYSSVTERELDGTSLTKSLCHDEKVFETAVWDESYWDNSVFAADNNPLEEILSVISHGAFPRQKERGSLSKGLKSQLRDAMILENALREGCDIIVSNDVRAFIGRDNSVRVLLEKRYGIKIFTVTEFFSG